MQGFDLKLMTGVLAVVALLSGSGCAVHTSGSDRSHVTPQVYVSKANQSAYSSHSNNAYDQAGLSAVMRGGNPQVHQTLKQQYSKWAGTPYRFGGDSYKGIDCSALVMNVFNDAFNRRLPRTTEQQVNTGNLVSKNELKVGDLVFFRTGRNQRHVGVFMGSSAFLHASVSEGVTISRLDDPYWSARYWQSRRVL